MSVSVSLMSVSVRSPLYPAGLANVILISAGVVSIDGPSSLLHAANAIRHTAMSINRFNVFILSFFLNLFQMLKFISMPKYGLDVLLTFMPLFVV